MAKTVQPRPKRHKLAFIVSNSLDKPDSSARLLIRSHVMHGKNRRKRAADRPSSWINHDSSQSCQVNSAAGPGLYFPLAMQIGSGLPITQFAYDMPPYALDLVFKWFTVVGQEMYPIELCVMFDVRSSIWVEYLAVDALYCHSVLWTTQVYFDRLKGVEYSTAQIEHAHKTLVMLQQRLTDSRLATSDATMCVVVCLVMMTALMGDNDSSRKHMMGLYKMVKLRGGVRALQENGQVQVKICRADLTLALRTGKKPMFFSDAISWEPYIATLRDTSHESPPENFLGLDKKLRFVWADLREFTRSANLAFQTGQKMDCVLFQEILVSVLYRLQLLHVNAGSPDEAIHVGMLAFSANVFLRMHGLAMRFEKLASQLRDSVLGLQDLEDGSTVEFKLWLLFVAQMSFGADHKDLWLEPELKQTLQALSSTSWKTTRDRLKQYLWIDVLHDNGGKNTFDDASNS